MIELKYIITNGYPNAGTIDDMAKKGWKLISIIPANMLHPHALDTDKMAIFGIYREYEKGDISTANA
jgi:hypothetical protein